VYGGDVLTSSKALGVGVRSRYWRQTRKETTATTSTPRTVPTVAPTTSLCGNVFWERIMVVDDAGGIDVGDEESDEAGAEVEAMSEPVVLSSVPGLLRRLSHQRVSHGVVYLHPELNQSTTG
jgi:hypothetical protein